MPTALSRATAAIFAVGLSCSAGAVLALPASAAAAPAGLSFLPAKGLASTPMTLLVPAPCPSAATNVIATAYGHGFPADGQTVVGNSRAGVSHTAPFALPLQDTFTGFAADNGTTLSGPYKVTLACIDSLGAKTYATFTATITFADAAHFSAPAPTDALVAAIQQAELPTLTNPSAGPSAKPQPGGPSVKPGASKGGVATGTGGNATGGGETAANAPSSESASKSKSSFPWEPVLIVAAFVLIALGILLRIREIRGSRRRAQSKLKPGRSAVPTDSPDNNSKSSKPETLTGSGSANNHGKGHHS